MNKGDIVISGVGGQGILLASGVLALAAQYSGFDVKMSEVHGMAQRGGSVVSQVRFASRVFSPLIPERSADFLLAFEPLEALRYLHYLKPGGTLIVNHQIIPPVTVLMGLAEYPDNIVEQLTAMPGLAQTFVIDATAVARDMGYARVANMVLLGALARLLDIDRQVWLRAITERIPPAYLDVNKKAFRAGWEMV